MKKILLVLALVSFAACGKSVHRDGVRQGQGETDPATDPTVCAPTALGSLLDYSIFVGEELRTDHVSVGGRVAASYACVQHGEIGSRLQPDESRVDLASAGLLGVNVTKIRHGKATFGKGPLDRKSSSALGGFEAAAYDIGATTKKILDFSDGCLHALPNTSIIRECHNGLDSPETCTLRINGESANNIAELTPAQIANVTTFVIDIPRGTTLVTNLAENTVAVFRHVEVKFASRSETTIDSPTPTRIFWNFPAARGLEFTATKFRGTVVALIAGTKVTGQSGEGGFWVRKLDGNDSDW